MSKISKILSSHSHIQLPFVKRDTITDIQCPPSDQTPNRFLASCKSLIEANPFEQSFSIPSSLPPILAPSSNNSAASLPETVFTLPASASSTLPVSGTLMSTLPISASASVGSVSSYDSKATGKKRNNLESNRKAASRCRKKKKEMITKMQEETSQFEQENHELRVIAVNLELEIQELKAFLLVHRDCGQDENK